MPPRAPPARQQAPSDDEDTEENKLITFCYNQRAQQPVMSDFDLTLAVVSNDEIRL